MSSTKARGSVHTGASEATGPVVAFSQVSKSFGQVKAVSELDLTLHAGETVALLGPNGAGKSTALDLLLGLRNADSGSVRGLRHHTGARRSPRAGSARCCRAAA